MKRGYFCVLISENVRRPIGNCESLGHTSFTVKFVGKNVKLWEIKKLHFKND